MVCANSSSVAEAEAEFNLWRWEKNSRASPASACMASAFLCYRVHATHLLRTATQRGDPHSAAGHFWPCAFPYYERERESGSFLLIVVDSLTIAVREVETKERGADTWVHKGHYFVWYSRSTTIYPSAVPLVLSLILELLWSTLIPNDISYDQIYYPVKAI